MKLVHQLLYALVTTVPAILAEPAAEPAPEAARSLLERANIEARQTNVCGVDIASGLPFSCNPGYACCQGSVITECIPESAQCCSMGTFCDAGYNCMVDNYGDHFCQGSGGNSAAVASATGAGKATNTGSGTTQTGKSGSSAGNIQPVNAWQLIPLILGPLAVL